LLQKIRVYIETSVWSSAIAEDAPWSRAEAEAFFDLCRKRLYEPYISDAVLSEIQFARVPLRNRLEGLLRDVERVLLPWLAQADDLSDAFVRAELFRPASLKMPGMLRLPCSMVSTYLYPGISGTA